MFIELFNTWKFQAQTWGEHVVYRNCFWHSEQFLYTTYSPHVLQKEELLTKIYLYWKMVLSVRKCIFAFFVHEICTAIIFLITTLFLSIIYYLPRKIRCQQHSTNLNMPNFGYFHERSTRKLYLRHHFLWCWHPHFVRLLDTKKTATKGQ